MTSWELRTAGQHFHLIVCASLASVIAKRDAHSPRMGSVLCRKEVDRCVNGEAIYAAECFFEPTKTLIRGGMRRIAAFVRIVEPPAQLPTVHLRMDRLLVALEKGPEG